MIKIFYALVALVFVLVIYFSCCTYVAKNKWDIFQNGFKPGYKFIECSSIIDPEKWLTEFTLDKPDRFVMKSTYDEIPYSKALKSIGFEESVNGMISLHKWQVPNYQYFNKQANLANIKIGIIKAELCIRGDTIEILRKPNGEVWARSLLKNKQIIVWGPQNGVPCEFKIGKR